MKQLFLIISALILSSTLFAQTDTLYVYDNSLEAYRIDVVINYEKVGSDTNFAMIAFAPCDICCLEAFEGFVVIDYKNGEIIYLFSDLTPIPEEWKVYGYEEIWYGSRAMTTKEARLLKEAEIVREIAKKDSLHAIKEYSKPPDWW